MGNKLDASTKDEFRARMKVYFDRMKRLTENPLLESRIRFMVQVSAFRGVVGYIKDVMAGMRDLYLIDTLPTWDVRCNYFSN